MDAFFSFLRARRIKHKPTGDHLRQWKQVLVYTRVMLYSILLRLSLPHLSLGRHIITIILQFEVQGSL